MGTIGAPLIVTGAKGPRDLSMLASADAVQSFIAPTKEGEVVFRSRFRFFTLILKPEVRRQIGDEFLTEPPLKAVFDNFECRTTDPETIRLIRESKRFGLSLDFWDQTEAIEIAEEARYQAFVQTLDANPKLKQRLIVDAGLRDFKLPITARPIAPKGDAGLDT